MGRRRHPLEVAFELGLGALPPGPLRRDDRREMARTLRDQIDAAPTAAGRVRVAWRAIRRLPFTRTDHVEAPTVEDPSIAAALDALDVKHRSVHARATEAAARLYLALHASGKLYAHELAAERPIRESYAA